MPDLLRELISRPGGVRHYHWDGEQEELSQVPGLSLPYADYQGDSALHLLPVLLLPGTDRNALQAELRAHGIQSSVHYPPIHLFTWYRHAYGYRPGMLPVTESVASRELSLPMHARMNDDDVSESDRASQ